MIFLIFGFFPIFFEENPGIWFNTLSFYAHQIIYQIITYLVLIEKFINFIFVSRKNENQSKKRKHIDMKTNLFALLKI